MEAIQFIHAFSPIISKAAMQTYCSALPLMPSDSLLSKKYIATSQLGLKLSGSRYSQIVHNPPVSLSINRREVRDSTTCGEAMVVCLSKGIGYFNTSTGNMIGSRIPTGECSLIASSPDGQQIVTCHEDECPLDIWNVGARAHVKDIAKELKHRKIKRITFSADAEKVMIVTSPNYRRSRRSRSSSRSRTPSPRVVPYYPYPSSDYPNSVYPYPQEKVLTTPSHQRQRSRSSSRSTERNRYRSWSDPRATQRRSRSPTRKVIVQPGRPQSRVIRASRSQSPLAVVSRSPRAIRKRSPYKAIRRSNRDASTSSYQSSNTSLSDSDSPLPMPLLRSPSPPLVPPRSFGRHPPLLIPSQSRNPPLSPHQLVFVWDVETDKLLKQLEVPRRAHKVAISDTSQMAVADNLGIKIIDFSTEQPIGRPITPSDDPPSAYDSTSRLIWSSNGHISASAFVRSFGTTQNI